VHWCLNIVCGQEHGALLIRALEPTQGLELMRTRRGLEDLRLLCSGPGRLCQALAITGADDGLPLDEPPFAVYPPLAPAKVVSGPRIGISKAVERPWRYGLAGSRFLSRPFSARA
jgi:DNA-3-methyladenine glycosylase